MHWCLNFQVLPQEQPGFERPGGRDCRGRQPDAVQEGRGRDGGGQLLSGLAPQLRLPQDAEPQDRPQRCGRHGVLRGERTLTGAGADSHRRGHRQPHDG